MTRTSRSDSVSIGEMPALWLKMSAPLKLATVAPSSATLSKTRRRPAMTIRACSLARRRVLPRARAGLR
jgi:hypothetical protein